MMIQLLNTLNSDIDNDFRKKILEMGSVEIKKSLDNVDILIENILNFNRYTSLDLKANDPVNIIREVLSDLFSFSEDNNLKFIYNLKHTSWAFVDLIQFKRVFSNILSNAVDSMEKPGTITFSTKNIFDCGRSFIEFSITNTGSFIENHHLDKIFDLFFTHGKKNGNGIGLATSKKIIEDHGGTISCMSNKLSGTSFVFTVKDHQR